MQLFIHITNHTETVNPIMSKLMEYGITGASVVDCEGMLSVINKDTVDAPSMFGGLRQFLNPEHENNKMIFILLKDEDISRAVDAIHEVAGSLKLPNKGIMFTLPVTRWEGVNKE